MAIIQSNTTHVDTTDLKSTQFTVQSDAALFSVLTQRIYTDTILAPMREWSTNAIDACISAGIDPKFDVHLPTVSELTFSVRDYGTGLSQDDILNLFTVVGASTKRDSNLFNGQFGLGRLAALSYAESFTVESYFNGNYYSYLISLSEGIPVAIELASTTTSEPNGLRLSVPVQPKHVNEFHSRARDLYKYFNVKPCLNVPLELAFTPSISTDNWFIENHTGLRLLMSNIIYRIPPDSRINFQSFKALTLVVPTGAVSINPGRESLSLDDATINYLNQQFKFVADEVIEVINDIFAQAPNDFELVKAATTVYDYLHKDLYRKLTLNFTDPSFYINKSTNTWGGDSICLKSPPFTELATLYYGSKPRKDRYEYASTIYDNHILAIDVKTNYSHAIRDVHSKRSKLLIFYPTDKATFRESFDEWVESVGIPASNISYASDYQTTASVATKRLEGFYACQIATNGAIYANTLLKDTEADYLYFELSGSSFKDSDAVLLTELRARLTDDFHVAMPKLIGIQKKYLPLIEGRSNFIPARDYILNIANSQDWHVYDERLTSYDFGFTLPPVCPMCITYEAERKAFDKLQKSKAHTLIAEPIFAKFQSLLTVVPTTYTMTYSAEDIHKAYPLLKQFNYSFKRSEATYYMTLEAHYANTNPGKPKPSLSDQ